MRRSGYLEGVNGIPRDTCTPIHHQGAPRARPLKLKSPIILRNGKHAAFERSIGCAKRKMNKAKKLLGMQLKHEDDQIIVMCHLLQPQESGLELEPIKTYTFVIMKGEILNKEIKSQMVEAYLSKYQE